MAAGTNKMLKSKRIPDVLMEVEDAASLHGNRRSARSAAAGYQIASVNHQDARRLNARSHRLNGEGMHLQITSILLLALVYRPRSDALQPACIDVVTR
jgi:hypothetical protein